LPESFSFLSRSINHEETINYKIVATVALCGIGIMSGVSYAGPDEFQRQMTQRILQAKQKLQQAEAAKGADRQKMMGEHMKMMKENMAKMHAMKPKSGMSTK